MISANDTTTQEIDIIEQALKPELKTKDLMTNNLDTTVRILEDSLQMNNSLDNIHYSQEYKVSNGTPEDFDMNV